MRALPPPLCQVFTTPPLDPESLEARHALFYMYYQIQVKDPAQQQQAAPTAAAPGAGRTMRGQENKPHAGERHFTLRMHTHMQCILGDTRAH